MSKPFFGLLLAALALVVLYAVITGKWANVWAAITGTTDQSGTDATTSGQASSAGQPSTSNASFGSWGTTNAATPTPQAGPTPAPASSQTSYTNSIPNTLAAYEAAIPSFSSAPASSGGVVNSSPYVSAMTQPLTTQTASPTTTGTSSLGSWNLSKLTNLFGNSSMSNASSEPSPLPSGTVADNPADTGQVGAITSGIAAGLTDGLSTLALAA